MNEHVPESEMGVASAGFRIVMYYSLTWSTLACLFFVGLSTLCKSSLLRQSSMGLRSC